MYLSLTVTFTRPSTCPVSTSSCRHCPAQKGQIMSSLSAVMWICSTAASMLSVLQLSFPMSMTEIPLFSQSFPHSVGIASPQAEDVHLSNVFFLSPNPRQCSAKGNHRGSSALSSLFISPMSLFAQYFSPAAIISLMEISRFPQLPVMQAVVPLMLMLMLTGNVMLMAWSDHPGSQSTLLRYMSSNDYHVFRISLSS